MGTDARTPDDPAIAALRQVASTETTRSIKQTILACLLIRSVLRPPSTRGRTFITTAAVSAAGLAVVHWHVWPLLLHLLH
jgi:hypothetical protein